MKCFYFDISVSDFVSRARMVASLDLKAWVNSHGRWAPQAGFGLGCRSPRRCSGHQGPGLRPGGGAQFQSSLHPGLRPGGGAQFQSSLHPASPVSEQCPSVPLDIPGEIRKDTGNACVLHELVHPQGPTSALPQFCAKESVSDENGIVG